MILEIAKKYNQMIVDKKVDQKELNQLLSVLDGTLNKEFIKVLEEKKINEQWTYVLDTLDKKLKNVTSLDIFLNENKVFSKEDNLVKKLILIMYKTQQIYLSYVPLMFIII